MVSPSPLPSTYILASDYISLDRCAKAYRQLLADLGCLAPSLDAADVVILHVELGRVGPALANLPGLRGKKVVGYLVWETDRLPPGLGQTLQTLDAIWTPSWFSARSFTQAHPQVRWLPHVIEPGEIADAASVQDLRDLLQLDGTTALLHVLATANDPRKAAQETEDAFLQAARLRPGLRLITKQLHRPVPPPGVSDTLRVYRRGPITTLSGRLTATQMAALYAISDWVVSGAHAEGWGLTLSDAMAHGVPTIAPNYSGQRAFLHPSAGLFVPVEEDEVRPAHYSGNFKAPMRWGYMLPNQFVQTMAQACDLTGSDAHRAMRVAGRRLAQAYAAPRVRCILRALLQDLGRMSIGPKT